MPPASVVPRLAVRARRSADRRGCHGYRAAVLAVEGRTFAAAGAIRHHAARRRWGSTGPTGPWCRPTGSGSHSPRGPKAGARCGCERSTAPSRRSPIPRARPSRSGRPTADAIAFFAGGKLKKVDATGGPVTVLADSYSVSRGAWSPAGTILFVPRSNGPDPCRRRHRRRVARGDDTRCLEGRDEPSCLSLPAGRSPFPVRHLRTAVRYLRGVDRRRVRARRARRRDRRDVCASRLSAVQPATDADGAAIRRQHARAARHRRSRLPIRSPAAPSRRRTRERSSIAPAAAAAVSWPGSNATAGMSGLSARRPTISRSSCLPADRARRCSASTRIPATPTSGWSMCTPASHRA